MEFILNKTLGINGIDRISFKKIIEILGRASKIKLELGKDNFDLNITLEYKQLELIINYCVNFYLGTRIPEFQTLFFVVEKLYLDNEVIKIGEDVRKVFTKVKRYTKNNYKIFNYEYNIGEYSGSYDFNNQEITYHVELAKDPSFKEKILDKKGIKELSIKTDRLPKGQYFIRIFATNETGNSQAAFDYYRTDTTKQFGVSGFYVMEDGGIKVDTYENR